MPDLLAQLEDAKQKGELEPWKAMLLAEWIKQDGLKESSGPSPEDLSRLLVDPPTLGRLKKATDGPWDILHAQARSILAHEHVGTSLEMLASK